MTNDPPQADWMSLLAVEAYGHYGEVGSLDLFNRQNSLFDPPEADSMFDVHLFPPRSDWPPAARGLSPEGRIIQTIMRAGAKLQRRLVDPVQLIFLRQGSIPLSPVPYPEFRLILLRC